MIATGCASVRRWTDSAIASVSGRRVSDLALDTSLISAIFWAMMTLWCSRRNFHFVSTSELISSQKMKLAGNMTTAAKDFRRISRRDRRSKSGWVCVPSMNDNEAYLRYRHRSRWWSVSASHRKRLPTAPCNDVGLTAGERPHGWRLSDAVRTARMAQGGVI
jgi:hypothetical protein